MGHVFMDNKTEKWKENFLAGCRIVLDFMGDNSVSLQGTQGTITGVDAQESIMVSIGTIAKY